nr:hypothetical protein [Tanacetum cinerariifolium]
MCAHIIKTISRSYKRKRRVKTQIRKWENSSKGLNKLLDSQLSANDKAGLGHDGAKESKFSETITSVSKVKTSNSKTSNDKVEMPKIKNIRISEPIIEEWESESKDTKIVVKPKEVTKAIKPSFEKIKSVNARNETVRQAENLRKNNKSPRGNKRKWNGMMTQKLVNYNRYFNKRVNTVKGTKVNTARLNAKVNTVKGTKVNTARLNAKVNTVKASGSWVWKPKHEESDHVSKSNSASKTLTRYDYVDAIGRFKFVGYSLVKPYYEWVNGEHEALKVSVFMLLVYVILPSGYTASTGVYTYYCLQGCKELASPKQAAFEFINHSSDNEESLSKDASKQGRIDDADAEVTFIDETSNDARSKNKNISNNKR